MDDVRRRDLRPPARRPTWGQVRLLRVGAVLCVLGGLVCAAVYAAVVPSMWAERTWETRGPLDLASARPPGDTPVLDGALSGRELVRIEDEEYGLCDVQRIAAAELDGRRVAALHDLNEDRTVCAVTIRDAVTGEEIVGAGGSALAKAGGFWTAVGPVKTEMELWLGGAAALVLPLGVPGLMRWTSRVRNLVWPAVVAPVVLVLAAIGVLVDLSLYPDSLSAVVIVLVLGSGLLACLAGGARVLLASDAFRETREPARREDDPVRIRRLAPWTSLRRRGRPLAALPSTADQSQGPAPSRAPAPLPIIHTGALPNFTHVGGMEQVKSELLDSLGLLLAFPDEAKDFGIAFNGILLHGPPGTGKTHLARATAGEFGMSFLRVSAGDLVSKYVGGTADNVRRAFLTAAANVPCLLFFDEFDALAARRGEEPGQEDRRTVGELLTCLEEHRTLRDLVVVAATNDLDGLDPAVVRRGRFDRHIRVDLPDATGRAAIVAVALEGRPVHPGLRTATVVRRTEGSSAADLVALVDAAALHAFRLSTEQGRRAVITERMLLDALDARGGQDRPTLEDWTWDNLVLAEATRRELVQVQRLLENTEEAHAYGVHPPSGMLLTGPPGTGKTTVARVLAAQAQCSFYPVTVADVLSKWVGESEAQVKRLFARARANAPSIIFLDEIDALAGRRGSESTTGDRLLNQLLAEMDGMSGRADVFVLAATNRPDVLDPALLRGGRLSRQVEIGLPDAPGRRRLLTIYTRSMPLEHVDLDEVVAWTSGFSGADIAALCQQAAIQAMIEADVGRTPGIPARRAVMARDFDRALSLMIEQRSAGGT